MNPRPAYQPSVCYSPPTGPAAVQRDVPYEEGELQLLSTIFGLYTDSVLQPDSYCSGLTLALTCLENGTTGTGGGITPFSPTEFIARNYPEYLKTERLISAECRLPLDVELSLCDRTGNEGRCVLYQAVTLWTKARILSTRPLLAAGMHMLEYAHAVMHML